MAKPDIQRTYKSPAGRDFRDKGKLALVDEGLAGLGKLGTYANDAAALAAGLVATDFYVVSATGLVKKVGTP